nr:hypothetical protein [Candidatus Sigynarchaeota archaeon]
MEKETDMVLRFKKSRCQPDLSFIVQVEALAGSVPVFPGFFTHKGSVFEPRDRHLESFVKQGVEAGAAAFYVTGIPYRSELAAQIAHVIYCCLAMVHYVRTIDGRARSWGFPATGLAPKIEPILKRWPDPLDPQATTIPAAFPSIDAVASHLVSFSLDGVLHEIVVPGNLPSSIIMDQYFMDMDRLLKIRGKGGVMLTKLKFALAYKLRHNEKFAALTTESARMEFIMNRYDCVGIVQAREIAAMAAP